MVTKPVKTIYNSPAVNKLLLKKVDPKQLGAELNETRVRVTELVKELSGDKRVLELRNNFNGLLRFFVSVAKSKFPLYMDRNLSLIQAQLKSLQAQLDKLEK